MKKQLIGFCFTFVLFSINIWAQKTKIVHQLPLSQELQSKLCRLHEIEMENTPRTRHTNAPAAKQEVLPVLKIDSIIWKGKDMKPAKEEYVFDSHGNRTLTLGFYWHYNN